MMDIVIKLSKMADQIEMTTAEGPRQNLFHSSFHVFGKTPVATPKTFSFNMSDHQILTKKVKEKMLPKTR